MLVSDNVVQLNSCPGGKDLLASLLLCGWSFHYVFLIGLACFEQ